MSSSLPWEASLQPSTSFCHCFGAEEARATDEDYLGPDEVM